MKTTSFQLIDIWNLKNGNCAKKTYLGKFKSKINNKVALEKKKTVSLSMSLKTNCMFGIRKNNKKAV